MGLLLLALDFADLEIPLIPHGLHRPGLYPEKKVRRKKRFKLTSGGLYEVFVGPEFEKRHQGFSEMNFSLAEIFRIRIRRLKGLAFTMTCDIFFVIGYLPKIAGNESQLKNINGPET